MFTLVLLLAAQAVPAPFRGMRADFRALKSALHVGINCPLFQERMVNLKIKIDALPTDNLRDAEEAYDAGTQFKRIQASSVRCPEVDMDKIDSAVDDVLNWKPAPAKKEKAVAK